MSKAGADQGAPWLRGIVKAVPSGDSLVIMAKPKSAHDIPPTKTITLSSVIAPTLAHPRGGIDEPFAWGSREYLRKVCIGKEVVFRVDSAVPAIRREFGSVLIEDQNVAALVVASGWAKVKGRRQQQKGEVSPILAELLHLEEQAKEQGLGCWSMAPGAAKASIRNLPPSAVHDPGSFDAKDLLGNGKGVSLEAIVESVPNGSMLHVYLLPQFQYVGVLVAGVQAPSVGRYDGNVSAEPFGLEAKHFTECHVLHRDVRVVLEGVEKGSNLIGSVYYPDGDSVKDLGLGLVENGLAKYVKWSAVLLENDAERKLRNTELESKKAQLRMWANYIPPPTNSKAVHSQNFVGKVVEVVSGDCIIVNDDSIAFGDPSAERRVNLSSIRVPKMGNPRKNQRPEPYALDAKEYVRSQLIGQQVNVFMEYKYTRKVDGFSEALEFGSVFLDNSSSDANNTGAGKNIAELLVARGYALVVQHHKFEERSSYYDALLGAEAHARMEKLGLHSGSASHVRPVKDLLTATRQQAKDFLPFLKRSKKMPAIVDYVLSGHRYKVYIPGGPCSIAFSLNGVRCQGRNEPYGNETIAFMRQKILQRDVEIVVETVDRSGTFLGTLWESKTNVAIALLEAGLAKLQTSLSIDSIHDGLLLSHAESCAKQKSLKIWKDHAAGEKASGVSVDEMKQKEELEVVITEVLDGGIFYMQTVAEEKVAATIQEQISSLDLQEPPAVGTFYPKRGDIVLSKYTADDSWNRATVVKAPKGRVRSLHDKYEVFYLDYGNQEVVQYRNLRPLDPAVSSGPGCAQLCSLAHIRIPKWKEEYGVVATLTLTHLLLAHPVPMKDIHESDISGKTPGKGNNSRELTVSTEDNDAELTACEAIASVEVTDSCNETAPEQEKASSEETAPFQMESVGEDEVSTDIMSTGEGNKTFTFRAVIEGREKSGRRGMGQGTGTIYKVTLVDMEKNVSINATMLKEGLAMLEKMRTQEFKDGCQVFDELKKCQEEACLNRRGIWEYDDITPEDENH